MQAPWTEIGRLESDVRDLQYKLNQKVDSHEIHTLRSDVDSLEREMRELSSEVNELRYGLQTLQEEIRMIREASQI